MFKIMSENREIRMNSSLFYLPSTSYHKLDKAGEIIGYGDLYIPDIEMMRVENKADLIKATEYLVEKENRSKMLQK